MPNDTTTLNGALRQLGETMAANLTTQGVPSTYDEGLTTLAGKILDIQGGGGTRTLTLTADKSILSYYDSDEAVLSATLLEDGVAVSSATVEFFNGSTSMGTAQTDSNGVATKTYTSTGAGDISLTAKVGSLVSVTYTIEDCIFYYPDEVSITSNTSSDVIEKRLTDYMFTDLPVNFELSYDYKTTRCGGRIQLGSNANTSSSTANYQIGMGTTGGCKRASMARETSTDASEGSTISTNTYYNCRMVKNGNSIQYYWNDTLHTTKIVSWFEDYHDYVFVYGIWAVGTMTGKEFKIKPL